MNHKLTLTELILLRGFYKERIEEYNLEGVPEEYKEESFDFLKDLESKKSSIDAEIDNFVYENIGFTQKFGGANGNN